MFSVLLTGFAAGSDQCAAGMPCSACPCIDPSSLLEPFKGAGGCTNGYGVQNSETLEYECVPQKWTDLGHDPDTVYGDPPYGGGCLPWDIRSGPYGCWDSEKKEVPLQAPTYCDEPWCYIDPNNCALPADDYSASYYFPGVEGLFYSYKTCGGQNWFIDHVNALGKGVGELSSVIE